MRIINNLFKTGLDRFLEQLHPSNFFFSKILFHVPKVSNPWICQKRCFMKLFDSSFPYKHCFFKSCLPTRQNGVENRDKAYSSAPALNLDRSFCILLRCVSAQNVWFLSRLYNLHVQYVIRTEKAVVTEYICQTNTQKVNLRVNH